MKKKILKITAIVLAAIVLLFAIIAFTVSKILLDDMFGRAEAGNEIFSADDIDIEKREIQFDSEGNTLRGYVWGEPDSQKLIIISHGLGGNSNGYYYEMIDFVKHGYRVMTYDNTGTAKSDGKGTTGLSQSAVDLHNALCFAENDELLKDLPVYLFGHSWGGHAVTAVLNYGHEVQAVVSVAGYNSNGGIMLEWMKSSMGMGGFAYLVFPFAAFWSWTSAHGAYGYTGVKGINGSDVPVLIIQGGRDDMVWDDSLYNHRDEITNGKTEYCFFADAGHNDIFHPEDLDTDVNKALMEKTYSFFGKY